MWETIRIFNMHVYNTTGCTIQLYLKRHLGTRFRVGIIVTGPGPQWLGWDIWVVQTATRPVRTSFVEMFDVHYAADITKHVLGKLFIFYCHYDSEDPLCGGQANANSIELKSCYWTRLHLQMPQTPLSIHGTSVSFIHTWIHKILFSIDMIFIACILQNASRPADGSNYRCWPAWWRLHDTLRLRLNYALLFLFCCTCLGTWRKDYSADCMQKRLFF
jgi:hypothetical protein